MAEQNLDENWIFSTPRNGLFVMVDGKPVALKSTVYQVNAYMAMMDEQKKQNEKKKQEEKSGLKPAEKDVEFSDVLKSMSQDSLAIAAIALNPREDICEFPKDRIQKLFDHDQIVIMAAEWVDRKIFGPLARRASDPLLAAVPAQAK